MHKINVSFSSYTFARVAAMKGKLIGKHQYEKLLKMGYHEILRYLHESAYRKEIDEFDVSKGGLEHIEHALNAHLMRILGKLSTISLDGTREVIAGYVLRYDIENFKLVLRSVHAGVDPKDVEGLLYESARFSKSFWQDLLAQKSIFAVAAKIPFLKVNDQSVDLFALENILDRYYVEKMSQLALQVRGEGKLISQFLQKEVEMMNIKLLIRLLNQEKFDATQYLIHPTHFIKNLAKEGTLQGMISYLHKHKKTKLTGDEADLIEKLELELETSLLREEIKLMHRDILSVNYILGFMFAKEIEVRNLKALAKGKKLGIDQEFLENMLVIGS